MLYMHVDEGNHVPLPLCIMYVDLFFLLIFSVLLEVTDSLPSFQRILMKKETDSSFVQKIRDWIKEFFWRKIFLGGLYSPLGVTDFF